MTHRTAEDRIPTGPPARSAFARWAYLIFFGFVLIGPVFNSEAGPAEWALELTVLAVSLPLYLFSELRGWKLGGAVTLMAIAIGVTPLGSGAITVLPTFAAALLATEGTRPQLLRRLTAITVVVGVGIAISPIPWPYRLFMVVPIVMVWIVGLSVFEDRSLAAHADVLQAENRRVAHLATMAERERIARDLHDLAGQALTAIVLRTQIIQRIAATDPDRVAAEAAFIETTARDTLRSVRETVAGWHQASLTDELHVAKQALEAAGAEVVADGDWSIDLAPSVETVMAMALRESVTNIVRHARAGHVFLRLDSPDGGVRLTVSDDGVGPSGSEGSGIRGMRDRVAAAGGTFDLAAAQGTTVTIDMPFGGRQT